MILAIDPGPSESAYVFYSRGDVVDFGKVENDELVNMDLPPTVDHLAIEMVASYGMPVGAEVFETCVWTGRFIQWFECQYTQIYRKDVKLHLCGSMRAKDGNIRQAIIDRYPATGGGKCPQIGIKAKPGPLYGVSADVWAALAVAITYEDRLRAKVVELEIKLGVETRYESEETR